MTIEVSKDEVQASLFRALGDPTRLRIFRMLRMCGEDVEIDEAGQCRPSRSLAVSEVCCRLEQPLSTVSHHLRELRLAGLIRTEKRGRWVFCSVRPEALKLLHEYLAEGEAEGNDCFC